MKFIYNFLSKTKQCNCALHSIPEKQNKNKNKNKNKKTKKQNKTKERNEPYQKNFEILR